MGLVIENIKDHMLSQAAQNLWNDKLKVRYSSGPRMEDSKHRAQRKGQNAQEVEENRSCMSAS